MSFRTGLALLVLAALALRTGHAIGRQSLFCDEAIQFQLVASADSFAGVVEHLKIDAHPPLEYVFEYAARSVGLTTPDGLRVLPVLFGTLAVLLLGLIVRPRLGERAALIAAGMLAVSPFFIYFSGQLRNYSLFVLMSLVHFGFALRFAERRRGQDAALWGVSAGLLMLTHYYGSFHIATAGLFLLLTRRRADNYKKIALAAFVFLLVFAPWLAVFLHHLSINAVPWFEPLTDPSEAMLFARIAIGGGFVGWAIWFWACVRGGRATHRDAFRLAVTVSMGGCLLAWVVQHRFGSYQDRYVGPFAAIATIPVAFAISLFFRRGGHRLAGVAVILLVFLSQQMDARHWFRIPSPGAEAARIVAASARDDDVVCLFDPFVRVVWEHHDSSGLERMTPCHPDPVPFPPTPLLNRAGLDPDLVEQAVLELRRHLRAGRRVWYIGNGWYPSQEQWASIGRPCSPTDAPLQRRFRAIHARLLRTCYAEAEPVFGWDAPPQEYWYPWTMLLFDPRAPELER